MKRCMICFIACILMLSGCQGNETIPESTDFGFPIQTLSSELAESEEVDECKCIDCGTACLQEKIESEPQSEVDENAMKAEFKVELTPYPDHLLVSAYDVSMTEDGYCISGNLCYGGDIVISATEKAVLDAGGLMRVFYEGQEVVNVTSQLQVEDTYSIVLYTDSKGGRVKLIPFTISRMDTAIPKAGEFKLCNQSVGDYMLVFDYYYQITVPSETITYPILSYITEHMFDSEASADDVEPMAFSEYYQMILDKEENLNCIYEIYLQDGQIVKIEQVAF